MRNVDGRRAVRGGIVGVHEGPASRARHWGHGTLNSWLILLVVNGDSLPIR